MKKITKIVVNLRCQQIGGEFLLGPPDTILDPLEKPFRVARIKIVEVLSLGKIGSKCHWQC